MANYWPAFIVGAFSVAQLAADWKPEWTWLASRPEPAEHGRWFRTGDAVAVDPVSQVTTD